MEEIKVMVADETHEKYVDTILKTIARPPKCAAPVSQNALTNTL